MTRFLSAAVLLLASLWALRYAVHVPAVTPASVPATEFSGERALRHVRAIAASPHATGSAGHARVAAYVEQELVALGLTPEIQHTTAIGTRYAEAGRVRNIMVRIPGARSGEGTPAVLLMAHYDGVPAAPAAGDDASGTGALLETLRALRADPTPLRHDLIALFTDGEEAGLLGAAAFVREHRWAKDVAVTLNFEARGTHGPSVMFETGPGNLDVVRVLRRSLRRTARAPSLATFVYRRLPNDTDLSELAALDKPALNFAFIGGVDRYHTSQDDMAHLDPRTVQHHGMQALALARAFGNDSLPRPVTGDGVFFDLPVIGLVVYPEGWAVPLALLALLPLVFAIRAMRRLPDERTGRGMLLGVAGTLVSGCGAVALGVGVAALLFRVHDAIGSGTPALSGLYVAGTALLTYALAAAIFALLRRWGSVGAMHLGAVALWVALGIALAAAAPGTSFLITWPALVAASALALASSRPRLRAAALAASGAFAILMVMPIIYLIGAQALGLYATGAVVIALFTALGAWLLADAFELWPGRAWRTSGTVAAAAMLLFLAGMMTVRTSDAHPVGSAFAYGVDADSGGAWLGAMAVTPWAQRALGDALRRGAADSTMPPSWFTRFVASSATRTAPVVPVPKAVVRVIRDSLAGGERHVLIHVRPAGGTRSILLRTNVGAVRATSFDGRVADTTRFRRPPRGRWAWEYFAPPDSGFTIGWTVARDARPTLEVVSMHPGVPQLPGVRVPERPPGVIPIQRGDVTLIYQRMGI